MKVSKVSVVIIAKRAEKTIRYTVESLLKQTVKPDEIIVVVDSLDDPTVTVLKDLPVKIVLGEGVVYGSARSSGVNASTSDIVAFIDADCIADRRWIESLLKLFSKNPNIMVQAGCTINIKSILETQTVNPVPLCYRRSRNTLKFAPTQNFAFRKQVINIIGNFDPWFKDGGENLDFCIKLNKAGLKIYYNPEAIVYHLSHRISLNKGWRDGRSRAKAFIKHRSDLLTDFIIALFHDLSLIAFITLLVLNFIKTSYLILTLSLMHRLYRMYINVKNDNNILTSLINSLTAYIIYVIHYIFICVFQHKVT